MSISFKSKRDGNLGSIEVPSSEYTKAKVAALLTKAATEIDEIGALAGPRARQAPVDWNPIHWVKDALHDLNGRHSRPIHRWVLKRIAQAGGFIEDDIRKAASFVWSHFHDVGNTISHLAGQIKQPCSPNCGRGCHKTWKGRAGSDVGWIGSATPSTPALVIGGSVLVNDAKSWEKDATPTTAP